MSIWGDIRKRGLGQELKEEDKHLDRVDTDFWHLYPGKDELYRDMLYRESIRIKNKELLEEIDKLRWDIKRMEKDLKRTIKCY